MTGRFVLKSLRHELLIVAIAIVLLHFVSWRFSASSFAQDRDGPIISSVEVLTPTVAQYEKFEIAFNVETSATHLNLPFDENPPAGVKPGTGVSVDALFSNDDWKTVIAQPAFFYQPFSHKTTNNRDHWTPNGAPHWLVRFAPRTPGDWQVRLRVRDRDGEAVYPEEGVLHFDVSGVNNSERYGGLRNNPYTRHGFLRVSNKDARYFEFDDGTPFLGVGYSPAVATVDTVRARFRDWQLNGLQFGRVWMSGSGINSSAWTPWAFPSQPYNFGLPAVVVNQGGTLDGADFAYLLSDRYPCRFVDFWQGGVPVQPNTTYSVTLRARLAGVVPKAGAENAGLTVLRDGWANNCNEVNGKPLVTPVSGSTDWFTMTASFKTGSNENFANYLFLTLQNIEKGNANVDAVRVFAADDPAQVNLLRDPYADSHTHYDNINAAKWDLMLQAAEERGVFLKVVVDEKNEWIRNRIQRDGTIGEFNNNNFYAADNTKVRWLDEAWWRYLIARWGYSTAIHSFEFINEGDPYNGNHYNAANAMARYFDENDPSQHMVTTSFWHSFPNPEFWSNPQYDAVDYADIHAYITTGWGPNASFVKPKYLETRPEFQYEGRNSFHVRGNENFREPIGPRGMSLNEPGEWVIRYQMKMNEFAARCGFGEGGSSVRVFWSLDGGERQGIVPPHAGGQDFVCTAPDGTFDWREFNSQTDREGAQVPMEQRLVVNDTLPHAFTFGISNNGGQSGDAWISDLELISPSGVRVPILGEFDTTPFDTDTAWLTAAYSELWGGASPVGAHKPVVRGETAVNSNEHPIVDPGLNQDKNGIWLHNFIWGQINPGGMYDLWWYGNRTIEGIEKDAREGSIVNVFLPYANFMADVPLNTGTYRDAKAISDNPRVRVWGQRDDASGRAHLWVQNLNHSWDRVVEGAVIEPENGTIKLNDMPAGSYQVQWWDTYEPRTPILKTEPIEVENSLELKLPFPLDTDIAIKIERLTP